MKKLYVNMFKILILSSFLLVTGCFAQPTPVATIDPQILASTISAAKTEAILTEEVKLTQAVTITQIPTNTPAATNTPMATSTKVYYTYTPTQGAYQCSITSLSPQYGANIAKGSDFDLNVTLQNTGTEKWSKNNIDFKYISGTKFQNSKDSIDLPNDVAAGDSINFVVDMNAKTDTGSQNMTWALVQSSTTICQVNVHFTVN